MDTQSLFYFTEVAKDLHMSQTANRLYISQQTLSNHIMRLEESFGIKLLHRKPTLSLTHAGEYVLAFAEKINREESNIKDVLVDILNEKRGMILFGASTLRQTTLLPDILPVFSEKYPNVEIRIIDEHSKRLQDLILNGELNMALIIPNDDHPKIERTTLMPDQLYLCATNSLLQKYYGKDSERIKEKAKEGAVLKDFSKLPFCILNNRIGKSIDRYFGESGFSPIVYTRSAHFQISNLMCFRGLAAAFATRTSLHNLRGNVPDDVNIFPLFHKGQPMYEETAIIRHKERYFCQYNQYFFDLITCYYERLEQLPIEQLISSGLKDYYPIHSDN